MRIDNDFWSSDSFRRTIDTGREVQRQYQTNAHGYDVIPIQQNPYYQRRIQQTLQQGQYPLRYSYPQGLQQPVPEQQTEEKKPPKPQPKPPQPFLEHGVKVGDRLWIDDKTNTITNRNTGIPAKLNKDGSVGAGQAGDWLNLTGDIYDKTEKRPYLASTVKYGDLLFMDVDKDGWMFFTNRKTSEKAVPLTDDNNEQLVYSVLVQKMIAGTDPPEPKLDSNAQIGNWMFFDPTTNTITSRQTQYPLYKDKNGGMTLEPTGVNFQLDAMTRWNMLDQEQSTGEKKEIGGRKPGLPGMVNFKTGERVYYDPLTNMFTNISNRPSVVPMYIHQERKSTAPDERAETYLVINGEAEGGVPMKFGEDTLPLLVMYVDPNTMDQSNPIVQQYRSRSGINWNYVTQPESKIYYGHDQGGLNWSDVQTGNDKLRPEESTGDPSQNMSWFQRVFLGGKYARTVTLTDAQGNQFPATIAKPPAWKGIEIVAKEYDPTITTEYDPATGMPMEQASGGKVITVQEKDLNYNGTFLQALQESALIPEQMVGKAGQQNKVVYSIAGMLSAGVELVASVVLQAISLLGPKESSLLYNMRQKSSNNVGTWGAPKTGLSIFDIGLGKKIDAGITNVLRAGADANHWINQYTSESASDLVRYAKEFGRSVTFKPEEFASQYNPEFWEDYTALDADRFKVETQIHEAQAKVLYDQGLQQFQAGDVDGARELILSAINEERQSDPWIDPYYFISWSKYPEKEKLFLENVADAVIQVGRPLTRQEIMDVANYYLDVTTEFTWQLAFDLANTAPVAKAIGGVTTVAGKVVGAPFRVLWSVLPEKGFKAFMTNVVLKKAASSTASKIFVTVFDPINTITRSIKTKTWVGTDSVVDVIGRMGDIVSEASKAANPREALIAALRATDLPIAITPRMIERLLSVTDIIAPEDWGKNAEAIFNLLVDETTEKLVQRNGKHYAERLLRQGVNPDNIEAQVRIVARNEATRTITAEEFAGKFAQEFKRRYMDANRAWEGSQVMSDSLLGRLGQWWEKAQKPIDTVASGYNHFMSLWTESVLARRPAWVMYNLIDNVLRYSMAIGTMNLSEILNQYDEMFKVLPEIPGELGIYHMSDMAAGLDSVMARTIRDPSLASMTPVSFIKHYVYAWNKALQDGYKFLTPYKAWSMAWRDFNGSIEFAYRLRLFHNKFLSNLARVEVPYLEGLLKWMQADMVTQGYSPEAISVTIDRIRKSWVASGSDPDKLKILTDLTNNASGDRVMSWWIPENVQHGKVMTPEDWTMFIGSIKPQLDTMVQEIIASGRDVTVDDINRFFNEIVRQIQLKMDDARNPEGMQAGLLGITADWVDEETDLRGAAHQLGFTDRGIKVLVGGEQNLPDHWSPNWRRAFKENGIYTGGKTPRQAFQELMAEFNKRASEAIDASLAEYPERLRAYQDVVARLEAQAQEVRPRNPKLIAAGTEAAESSVTVHEAMETLDPSSPIRGHAQLQLEGWDLLRSGPFEKFLRLVFPGPKQARGTTRGYFWDLYDNFMEQCYRIEASWRLSIASNIRSGTYDMSNLTALEFLRRNGFDLQFDPNGRITDVFVKIPGKETPHRLSKYAVEQLQELFQSKNLDDFSQPFHAVRLSEAQRVQGVVTQKPRSIPTLDELRQSNRAVGRALQRVANATTPEGIAKARRAAAVQLASEYGIYTSDFIRTALESGDRNDFHLLGIINKWLEPETPYTDLAQVTPEQVYSALSERRKYRIAYDVPDNVSDFKDEMLKILREQYGVRDAREADAIVGVYEAAAGVWAKRYNKSPEEFWSSVFKGFYGGGEFGNIYGATTFEQGRAVIRAFKKANATTSIHEFFHALRGNPVDPASVSWLPEADVQTLDNWSRPIAERNVAKKLEGMTVDAAERERRIQTEMLEVQARGWEFYMKSGKAPNAKLATIFEDLKHFLSRTYARLKNYFTGVDALPTEIEAVYGRILDDTWLSGRVTEEMPGVAQPVAVDPVSTAVAVQVPLDANGTPTIITDEMKEALRGLGYDDTNIEKMTPEVVWRIMMGRKGKNTGNINDAFTGEPLFQEAEEAGPIWYSQLTRTVEAIPQEKMTTEQLEAAIKKGGVKEDELEWTGFREWLESKGKGARVTRQEALDYLRENNVQVEEKVLGVGGTVSFKQRGGSGWVSNSGYTIDSFNGGEYYIVRDPEGYSFPQEYDSLQQAMDAIKSHPITPTKYENYTLPGGQNYRELLFTSPSVGGYSAPHFGEEGQNLLAHVRFDERVDVDGKRVLFVEEVQSDWHQAGREKGYRTVPEFVTLTENDLTPITYTGMRGDPDQYRWIDPFTHSEWRIHYNRQNNQWDMFNDVYYDSKQEVIDALNDFRRAGWDFEVEMAKDRMVPPAPFSKSWPEMVMKRMIRWASENGFDRISWTTGAQQAARYDLANFVDALRWEKSGDAVSIVGVKDGDVVVTRDVMASELPGTIGKEAAERIMSSTETSGELVGQDLSVGNQGMKQFYDIMLVDKMNKYVKKWGTSVSDTDVITHSADLGGGYKSMIPETSATVHTIDITPEMRQSVMQGQPLFQQVEEDLHSYPVKAAAAVDGFEWVHLVGGADAGKTVDSTIEQVAKDLGVVLKRVEDGQYAIPGMTEQEVISTIEKVQAELSKYPIRFTDKNGGIWEVTISFNQGTGRMYAQARGIADQAAQSAQAKRVQELYRKMSVAGGEVTDPRLVTPAQVQRIYTDLDDMPERYGELIPSAYSPDGKPVLFQSQQQSIPDEVEFWKSWINVPRWGINQGGQNIRSLLSIFLDESVDLDDPIATLNAVERAIDAAQNAGLTNQAVVLREIYNEANATMQYVRHSVMQGDIIMPPPIPMWKFGHDMETWLATRYYTEGAYTEALKLLEQWRQGLIKEIESGAWWSKPQSPEVIAAVKQYGEMAARAKAEMLDAVLYGGNWEGHTLEGAVPYTNKWMIDYSDYYWFEGPLRFISPFFMFPTRSAKLWAEQMAHHPALATFYFKYLQGSRRVSMQSGAINSRGEQLPSLVGYMPIPGTNLWFNPTAPLSFRMLFPIGNNYTDAEEDQTIMGSIASWVIDASTAANLSLNPIVYYALASFLQEKSPFHPSIYYEGVRTLVPIELLPPWTERAVLAAMNKAKFLHAPDKWSPDVGWKDYLIEKMVLEDHLKLIRDLPEGSSMGMVIAQDAYTIIKNPKREEDPRWIKYRDELERSDYWHKMGSYFLGFYTKSFTPEMADLLALRDEINGLRDNINDEIRAKLFSEIPGASDRYQLYTDTRYNTPEGWIANLYNKIRWVSDKNNDPLEGQARRDKLAQDFLEDETVEAFYNAITLNYQSTIHRLQELPIGVPTKYKQDVWKQFFDQDAAIRNNPAYKTAQRVWAIGYKPTEMLETHFLDEWWDIIGRTKPQWDIGNEELYADFQKRVTEWENDLPLMAQTLLPGFVKNLEQYQSQLHPGQTLEHIPSLILRQTTKEGYAKRQKDNDIAVDALSNAYYELYLKDYTQLLYSNDKKTPDEITQLIRQFYDKHPRPPTIDEMIVWIDREYNGRFSWDELEAAAIGRDILDMASRQLYGNTDLEKEAKEVGEWIDWAGPFGSNGRDELEKYLKDHGWWDLDTFTKLGEVEYAKRFPDDFKKLRDILLVGKTELGLKPLSNTQLSDRIQAKHEDDLRKQEIKKNFGEDIYDLQSEYLDLNTAERRQWRKENADKYKRLKEYWDWLDQWEKDHPHWSKYFGNGEDEQSSSGSGESSGKKGRSSGGRGYSSGYGRNWYYGGGGGGGWGGGGGGGTGTLNDYIAIGSRTTYNPMELLNPNRKLGSKK